MTTQITPQFLTASARRAAKWLVSRMRADGSYEIDDVGAYYKVPYVLRIVGQSAAAAAMLQYVADRFMTPDYDFVDSPTKRTDGNFTSLFCNIYPSFWFLRAAVVLNRFDLAGKIFSFMETLRNNSSGAYRSLIDPGCQRYDANSTASGCIGCLLMGQIDKATTSGNWLIDLLDKRPDKSCYHICQEPDGQYVSDWPEGKDLYYIIRQTQPDQYYFIAGLPMVALAQTYQATQDDKYLQAAIRYCEFLIGCSSDVKCSAPSGKLGWGAAILYRLTGNPRYRDTAETVMRFITGVQSADGYILMPRWSGRDITSIDDQGLGLTYNWTGEYATWMADVAAELAAARGQAP